MSIFPQSVFIRPINSQAVQQATCPAGKTYSTMAVTDTVKNRKGVKNAANLHLCILPQTIGDSLFVFAYQT